MPLQIAQVVIPVAHLTPGADLILVAHPIPVDRLSHRWWVFHF